MMTRKHVAALLLGDPRFERTYADEIAWVFVPRRDPRTRKLARG